MVFYFWRKKSFARLKQAFDTFNKFAVNQRIAQYSKQVLNYINVALSKQ